MENINPDWQNHRIDKTKSLKNQYAESLALIESYLSHWHITGQDLRYHVPNSRSSVEKQNATICTFQDQFNPNFIVRDLLSPVSTTRAYKVNQILNNPLNKVYELEGQERKIAQERKQPYIRMLNLFSHPFSHMDSSIEDIKINGNTQRSNFIIDMCMLANADGGLNEQEILIIRTLMKSRINLTLREDFAPDKIIQDRKDNPEIYIKRVREMLYLVFCFDFVSDLIDSAQCKILTSKLKDRVTSTLKTIEFNPLEIEDFSTSSFLTSFFKSAMSEGGYSENCRSAIQASISQMSHNPKYAEFCKVLLKNQNNPENLDNINRELMPNLHQELLKILHSYGQTLPNQVYRPSKSRVEEIVSICESSYLCGHTNDELGLTKESLKNRYFKVSSTEYYASVIAGEKTHSNIFTVNDNAGELSGFITIKEHSPQYVEVLNLFIDSAKIGQGLGSNLITQVLDRYKRNRISVNVASHNDRAVRFYQKNGFKVIKDRYKTNEIGNGLAMQVTLMEIPQTSTERIENWIKYIFYQTIIEVATRTSTFAAKKI